MIESLPLLPDTLFLPGLNSSPVKLIPGSVSSLAGYSVLCSLELPSCFLCFLGPKLVSFSSSKLTPKLKAGPASACPLLRLLHLPPNSP